MKATGCCIGTRYDSKAYCGPELLVSQTCVVVVMTRDVVAKTCPEPRNLLGEM